LDSDSKANKDYSNVIQRSVHFGPGTHFFSLFMAAGRRPNWEQQELTCLLDTVGDFIDIINASHSQAGTEQRKKRTWEEISTRVSSVGNGRSTSECKKKWTDYASRVKKKEAGNNSKRRLTGGGPSQADPLTNLEEQALALVPSESLHGIDGGVEAAEDGAAEEPTMSAMNQPSSTPRVASRARVAAADNIMSQTLALEEERLAVEKERLAVEKERLAVERERLAVERERLAVEKAKVEVHDADNNVIFENNKSFHVI
jgi:hypothetical protein